jgi:hypothetical protein
MPGDLKPGTPAQPSVARAARWPAGVLALSLAALVVLWLHALALQGLAQALPGLGNGASTSPVNRAFITRTVQFDNGADKAPVAPAPAAAAQPPAPKAARKPAGAAFLVAPEVREPVAAQPAPIAAAGADPQPATAPQDSAAMADAATAPSAPASGLAEAASTLAAVSAASASATASQALIPPPVQAQAKALVQAQAAAQPVAPGALPTALAGTSASAASLPGAGTGSADAPALPVYDYRFPGSTRLKYDVSGLVKGFRYYVSGELLWLQDGKTYDARLEISHFLLGSRVQTSKGALTPQGLEPLRFGDKVRSEVAAHFQRGKGLVTFSANTPEAPLMPLAQDQLSIFVQLAAMWGANAGRFAPGLQLPFQAVGPRTSENWTFLVGAPERLKIDGREFPATRLIRERSGDFDTRVELWLAPALDYLPARIRLTQSNGDEVDMLWSRTEKP